MGGGSFVSRPFINREAAVGEALVCEREPENTFDRYAVAVKKEGTIIGDLPPKLLRVFAVFATGRYTVASVSVKHKQHGMVCTIIYTIMIYLFTVEKICCRKYFVRLILVALCDCENFSTTKISQFTYIHTN